MLTGGAAAAGLAGFQAGAMAGFVGGMLSSAFLAGGNNIAFGDPMPTARQFVLGVAISTFMGGTISGIGSSLKGNNFWNGTTSRISVPASSLKPAGLVGANKSIEVPKAEVQNLKLPSTTKPNPPQPPTTSSTQTVKIEGGKIDLSKNPDFRIKDSGAIKQNTGTGTPNSVYEYQAPNGKPISQHFYNSKGLVEFEINFKPHNMGGAHGHLNSIPGNIMSGHLPENHIPLMLIPKKYW